MPISLILHLQERNGNPLQYSCLENSMGYSPWGHKELDITERLHFHFHFSRKEIGLPGGLVVKNPPAMRETGVHSLGWDHLLEKGTATHSRTLAWKIPWATVHGVAKSRTWLNDFTFTIHFSCTTEFTAAQFTIARTWKQPKGPSMEEWIKM